jgi:hypothetical protein
MVEFGFKRRFGQLFDERCKSAVLTR